MQWMHCSLLHSRIHKNGGFYSFENVFDIATLLQILLTLLPYGIKENGNIIIRLSTMHVIVSSIYVMSTIIKIFSFIWCCIRMTWFSSAFCYIGLALVLNRAQSDRAQVIRIDLYCSIAEQFACRIFYMPFLIKTVITTPNISQPKHTNLLFRIKIILNYIDWNTYGVWIIMNHPNSSVSVDWKR